MPLPLLPLLFTTLGCQRGHTDSDTVSESAETGTDSVDDTSTEPVGVPLAPMDGMNVIVIVADTLREDHLPQYGYSRDTTPKLNAYPWHVVSGIRPTGPWTLPSTASLMTGLSPQHHHQLTYNEDHTTNAPLNGETFAQRLGGLGWDTAIFSGNGVVSPYTGLEVGFDTAEFMFKGDPGGGPNGGGTMETLGDSALAWIDQRTSTTPFMIHLQVMNMHQTLVVSVEDLRVFRDERVSFPSDALGGYSFSQYSDAYRLAADDAAREEMRLGLVDVYDGALISIDREAAQFLDALQARGLLDHTVIVFTSDHGETLDEEGTGTWGHGNSLREELTRVPLMILQPGGEARTTECVGSNTDIWTTLWPALGLPPLEGLDGIDLTTGCRAEADANRFDLTGMTDASAGNEQGKLAVHCLSGAVTGTNVGEGANVYEDTPGAEVNDQAALRTGLSSYVEDIAANIDGVDCAF